MPVSLAKSVHFQCHLQLFQLFFFFVHFLYSFAQFCSAVMEEANTVELWRCFSATENKNRTFFILSSLKSHHE